MHRFRLISALVFITGCYDGIGDGAPASGTGGESGDDAGDAADGAADDAATDDAGTGDDDGDDTDDAAVCDDTYEPTRTEAYASKVKQLLNGAALTAQELDTLNADPEALADLIDVWQDETIHPQAAAKRIDLFRTAFQQQSGLGKKYWSEFFGGRKNGIPGEMGGALADGTNVEHLVRANVEESFARTAEYLVAQGRPFTEVVTTRTFMLTTALRVTLAFHDTKTTEDHGDRKRRTRGLVAEYVDDGGLLTFQTGQDVPWSQTIDPGHANFMVFNLPECASEDYESDRASDVFRYMMGRAVGVQRPGGVGPNGNCGVPDRRQHPVLHEEHFADWAPVQILQPDDRDDATYYLDFEALAATDTLYLNTPRIGYFTTPGFFMTWQTNADNQARVSMNQTLITALGTGFDGQDSLVVIDDDPLDAQHADDPVCAACHNTLDPMRQFFRRSFSYTAQEQLDPLPDLNPVFARGDELREGEDIFDLARFIAEDPAFARTWVQRLCHYANSAPCPTTNDEFKRIVDVFVDSGHDFKTLVRALFSSPLVTDAACIKQGTGGIPSLTRANHLCAALSQRLEIPDVCGLESPGRALDGIRADVDAVIDMVPTDSFGRGRTLPITITDPNLFVDAATADLCARLGGHVVDDGAAIDPNDRDGAVEAIVTRVMGLATTTTAYEGAKAIINKHIDDAMETGADERMAIESAFIVGCRSPMLRGVGL